jgi:hypothetical protein
MSGLVIATIIGGSCLIGAVLAGVARVRFLRRALRVLGSVEEVAETRTEGSEMSFEMVEVYDSVVSFTPQGDAPTRLRTQHGKSKPRFSKGDTVEVLYLPNDPAGTAELVRLGRLSDLVIIMLCLAPVGLLFLLPAISVLLRGR